MLKLGIPAPRFRLLDTSDHDASLADYQGSKNLVLVFLRGFS